MPRRHRLTMPGASLAGVLCLVALLPMCSRSNRTAPNTPAFPAVEGKVETYLLHLDGQPIDPAVEAKRHRVIVLNAWEHSLIPKIKASNPSTLVFVYKDLSSTRSYAGAVVERSGTNERPCGALTGAQASASGCTDSSELPTGVGYVDAIEHHAEWFLHDGQDKPYQWCGYPGHWAMDVGNPEYQRAWSAAVIADAKAHHFDGIWMDNALTKPDSYCTVPSRYPTAPALQAAYRSMLTLVGAELRSAGLGRVANISDNRQFAAEPRTPWAEWVPLLDGGAEEQFEHFGSDATTGYLAETDDPTGWQAQRAEVIDAVRAGKFAAVHVNGDDGTGTPALRYGLATLLLDTDGRSLFGFGDTQTEHEEYGWNLGRAEGAATRSTSGGYQRTFRCGMVIVNPSPTKAITVSLNQTYTDESGGSVTSVTVPPTRASILRIVSAKGIGGCSTG